MKELRKRIVNALKTRNLEVIELKRDKLSELRKLLRVEKALLKKMETENYQKQINFG